MLNLCKLRQVVIWLLLKLLLALHLTIWIKPLNLVMLLRYPALRKI